MMRRRGARLFAGQFAGNLLVLALGYYWLGIGETRAATLAWSGAVALAGLCAACWVNGGLLAFFRGVKSPGRTILRHTAPFLAAVVLTGAVYWVLARWEEYSGTPALEIASWLTLKLRRPIKPATVLRVFYFALELVRWMVIPVFVLPMLSGVASLGWRGFTEFGALRRSRAYWLAAPVLLVCALALPWELVGWVPRAASFGMQMTSFVARTVVAYLLFLWSWILLASLSSGGRPAEIQLKTAASP